LATIADRIVGVPAGGVPVGEVLGDETPAGKVPVGETLGAPQLETTPTTSAAVPRVVTNERRFRTMPLQRSGPPPKSLGAAQPRV
jgi:hypothetical protein